MKQISTDIVAFMQKFNQSTDNYVIQVDAAADRLLQVLGRKLIDLSKGWYRIGNEKKSIKAFRTALMMEELGETVLALGKGNEVSLFDATLDQVYVVVGTALAYGITVDQLTKGWDAVHASNMTKTLTKDGKKIGKGREYVPVDLVSILRSNEDGR